MWSSNQCCRKMPFWGHLIGVVVLITILEDLYLKANDLNSNWGIINCPVAIEKPLSLRTIMHVTCLSILMSQS